MKKTIKRLEKYRIRSGSLASSEKDGRNGAFMVPYKSTGIVLRVIASDGSDWIASGLTPPAWEHVSVSLVDRAPTWDEMCFCKGLFWDEGETVVQFHPAASEYVNYHPYALHLWKPKGGVIQLPPSICVGPMNR